MLNRIRIIYVIPSLYDSGVTKVLSDIIKDLNLKYFKPLVVTISRKPLGRYAKQITNKNIPIIPLTDKRNLFLSLKQIRKFRHIISIFKPRIIHYHSFKADCYRVFQPKNVYSISTAHNVAKDDFIMRYGFVMGKIMEIIELHLFKKMDRVVSVSNFVKEYLSSKGISALTIHNGTPVQKDISKDSLISKRLSNSNFLVLGEISNRKNVGEILKAFTCGHVKGNLYIVGNGPQGERLKKIYNNNTRIHFEGFSNNVKYWLRKTNVLVSASLSEGLPMGVIEAMSYGLSIILSNIPQHKELDSNTKTILYFNNCKQLSKEMNKQFPINNADVLRIQHNFFNSRLMTKNYEKCYFKLLKE